MSDSNCSTSTSWLQRFDLYEIFFQRLPKAYRREEAVLHSVVAITVLLAAVAGLVNFFVFHYTPIPITVLIFTALPGLAIVWIAGMVWQHRAPRLGLVVSSFAQIFLFLMLMAFSLAMAITTPYPIIDWTLLHWDAAIGFDTLQLMQWTHHHPVLAMLLRYGYELWLPLIVLTPMTLAILNQRKELDLYLLATFISFLLGGLIYYFLPTIAPAGILNSTLFNQDQHELVRRFYEVHHSLPITVFGGGMIAFPSFHVINLLLVAYAWRRWRWVFAPLALLIVFPIAATMLLGYHYLMDVMAAVVLVIVSLLVARNLLRSN